MIHTHIADGQPPTVGSIPKSGRRLDTGQTISNLDQADTETQKACGWYPTTVTRAELAANQIHGDPVYDLKADPVTVTYPAIPAPPEDPTVIADRTDLDRLRSRLPALTAKAKAILVDPAGATDWTAAERKVILAAVVVDLAQRHR